MLCGSVSDTIMMKEAIKDNKIMNFSNLSIFKNPPELLTERCILRKMLITDAQDVFEYSKDPEVSRFLLWAPHPSISYSRSYLKNVASLYKKELFYDWAITLKETKKMIGTVGFTSFNIPSNSAIFSSGMYFALPIFSRTGRFIRSLYSASRLIASLPKR